MKMRLFLIILTMPVFLFHAACRNQAPNVNTQTNRSAANTRSNANANANSNAGANVNSVAQTGEIPTAGYEVVRVYKHDPNAFTQGLVFHNGFLYESTGQNGTSSIRKVEFETGTVREKRDLTSEYFGEGATILNNKIFQITWTNKICFVYDANTLELLSRLAYNGEGWGLTTDGTDLIMSDGSNVLTFRNPNDFRAVRTVNVTHNNKPLYFLNELEYINGEVWANIWHSEEKEYDGRPNLGRPNTIARINPADGRVVGWIDLNNISPEDAARDRENTLNGIAYDAASNRIFVTGKKWRKLFEIKIRNS